MTIKEEIEQFVMEYGAREPLIALILKVVEECCNSFNEVFLVNITNQTPMIQKKMLDSQIKIPFTWLEE